MLGGRGKEICRYLEAHAAEILNFVVLDDDRSLQRLFRAPFLRWGLGSGGAEGRMLVTDPEVGLDAQGARALRAPGQEASFKFKRSRQCSNSIAYCYYYC